LRAWFRLLGLFSFDLAGFQQGKAGETGLLMARFWLIRASCAALWRL